ncbi:unnamed protein product [Urochloa humidicola]
MIEPYQELQSKDISRAEEGGVEARIIADEAFGVHSPVFTRTPTSDHVHRLHHAPRVLAPPPHP